ncbi:MAG: hypothetical protein R8G34_03575 [Paracoccaceae bacterium]|nr:hypothetical protein [Paracoccaceae bacterium]
MISNLVQFDLWDHVRSDCFTDLHAVIAFKDVPKCSPPLGVIGASPAFGSVPVVAKCIEVALRSRWCRVESGPFIKFDARHYEVQLNISFVSVLDPEAIVLVCFQPRERRTLKIVHDGRLLVLAWSVFGGEGDYPTHVPQLSVVAINECDGLIWVASHDLRRHSSDFGLAPDAIAVCIIGGDLLGKQISDGRTPTSVTVFEQTYHHADASCTS